MSLSSSSLACLFLIHLKCALTFKEYSVYLFTFRICEGALTVHFTSLPLTRVRASIRPSKDAVTMSLIIQIITFVHSTIWPCVLSSAMHVACMPITYIFAAVEPLVSTLPLHFVVDPVAWVKCSIGPEVCTESVLFSKWEMTVETRAISPTLNTLAMVKIIFPLANVPFLAILRSKVTKAICLVVFPLSFIGITIWAP